MQRKKNLSAMMRKHKQGGMLGSLMATTVAPKLAHLALDGISGLVRKRKGKRGKGIKHMGARGGAIRLMGASSHHHTKKKRGPEVHRRPREGAPWSPKTVRLCQRCA